MKNKFRIKSKILSHMQNWEHENSTVAENAVRNDTALPEMHQEDRKGMRVAWRTDVGRVRANNQDAVICSGTLMGVADGMGGHNGGEIASAGAREGLIEALKDQEPGTLALSNAVRKVNLKLFEQQSADDSLDGMGTTLTVLWVADTEVHIGHVGDSRAYLLRDGELRRMTSDHSMVAEMVRKGLLTEEQAACHPMRNYITRAVGTEVTIEVDTDTVERKTGDRWLVCSDGLHGLISEEKIKAYMQEDDLEKAVDQMLQEALNNGGRDNISLILLLDEGVGE